MYNRIRVDTTPPRIVSFTARPLVISPDGDGRSDRAKIRYRVGERATVELYVDGTRALRRLGTRTTGTLDWFGVAGGERLAEGPHTLRLVARDVAGNLGPRSGSRTVRIRFLALGRDRDRHDTRRRASRSSLSRRRGGFAGGSTGARASCVPARSGSARRASRGGTCSRSRRTAT